MSTPNYDLGDIEGAIRDSYDRRDQGVEGYAASTLPAAFSPVPEAAPQPEIEAGAPVGFINFEYSLNPENNHLDFTLQSQGIADSIEGIIAELKHTLGHLEASVAEGNVEVVED